MITILYPGNKFGDQIGFKLTLKMFVFTIWFGSQTRLRLLRAEGEESEELFGDSLQQHFLLSNDLPPLPKRGVAEQTFNLMSVHLALVCNDIFLCVLFPNHSSSLCRPLGLVGWKEGK